MDYITIKLTKSQADLIWAIMHEQKYAFEEQLESAKCDDDEDMVSIKEDQIFDCESIIDKIEIARESQE